MQANPGEPIENRQYRCICGQTFNNNGEASSHKGRCQQWKEYIELIRGDPKTLELIERDGYNYAAMKLGVGAKKLHVLYPSTTSKPHKHVSPSSLKTYTVSYLRDHMDITQQIVDTALTHGQKSTMRKCGVGVWTIYSAFYANGNLEHVPPSVRLSFDKRYKHVITAPGILATPNTSNTIEVTPDRILASIKGMIDERLSILKQLSNLKAERILYIARVESLDKKLTEAVAKNDRLLNMRTEPWRIRIDSENIAQAKE